MQSTLLCTCYRFPSGIDPRATREICGEYKEMDGILCLRGRGNLNIILQAKIRGWGIQKFVKDICQGVFLLRATLPRGL